MAVKYNNFHGWFPGEMYRGGSDFFPECQNEQLVNDLDAIIEEIDFDLEKFQALRTRNSLLIKQAVGLALTVAKEKKDFSADEQAVKDLIHRNGKKNVSALIEMYAPVYEALIEKGYTHEELTI